MSLENINVYIRVYSQVESFPIFAVTGFCEHGNEPSDSKTGMEFLE
jgi:hypothetical protein